MTGSLVSAETRQRVRDLATPIARGFGRLGLSPNALTVIGFVGTAVAGWAAASQLWLESGILVLVFGVFDLFDGALARATGRATRFGAFLDSTLDRAGEAVVYVGIVIGAITAAAGQTAVVGTAALAAATLVPYARAKAESLGYAPGSGMMNVGLAPREVRTTILVISLLLAGLNGGLGQGVIVPFGQGAIDLPFGLSIDSNFGQAYLTIGLGLIVFLATITAIQRILYVRAQAKEG